MTDHFEEVIATCERLRQIVSQPTHGIANKVIDHIDDICQVLHRRVPLTVVTTKGADGLIDVSPGNKRVDSFENILVKSE